MTTPLDLRATVVALIALTQMNAAELARRAQVHRPNLVGWLGGKERIFSEKNQRAVADVLGWRSGRLRSDRVHHWRLAEKGDALTMVLGFVCATGSNLVTVVVPVTGAAADGSAILVLLEGLQPTLEDATVIFVARDRGLPPVVTLIGNQLGFVLCRPHRVTGGEYLAWWASCSDESDPHDYWASFGQSAKNDILEFTGKVAMHDVRINLAESAQWHSVLAAAMQNGLCYDEIVERTQHALDLQGHSKRQ